VRYNFKVGDRVKLTGDSWPAVMRDQIVTVTADDSVHPEIKWNGAFFYVFPESGWDAVLVLPEEEEPTQPENREEVQDVKDQNPNGFEAGDIVRLTGADWVMCESGLPGKEVTVAGVDTGLGRPWFTGESGRVWWIYKSKTYDWSATLVTPAHLAAKVKEAEVVEEIQELDERDYFLPGDLVRLTGAGWAEEGMLTPSSKTHPVQPGPSTSTATTRTRTTQPSWSFE
jgi:hypothetical protein